MKRLLVLLSFLLISFYISAQKPELILPVGHILHASGAVYSPDERFVLTTSRYDNTAKLWETSSGKLFRTIYTTSSLESASFSPDGQFIMMISDFVNVGLYETLSGKLIFNLPHTSFVNSASFNSPADLILTATNHEINIWNAKNGKLVQSMNDSLKISSPFFLSDENMVFYISNNRSGNIWNRREDVTTQLFKESENIFSCRFIDDETKLLVTGINHVNLYDGNSGSLINSFGNGKSTIEGLSLSDDKTLLMIQYYSDYSPEIWNFRTNKLLYKIPHRFLVNCALFRPLHNSIFTSCLDMVRIWNSDNGALIDSFKVENIDYGSFNKTGKYFLSNSMTANDFRAAIWNIDIHKQSVVLEGSSFKLNGAVFSPDDNYILTSNYDMAKIWDIKNGKLLRGLAGHRRETNSAVYSFDGKLIVTSSEDGTVRTWDPETGKEIMKITDYFNTGIRPAINPDGSIIATANKRDNCIKLFNASTGQIIRTLNNIPISVDFSPDGKLLASSDFSRNTKIWEVSSGNLLQTLTHESHKVSTVSFSPDSRFVVTSSQDYAGKIWNVSKGELVASLNHDAWVNSAEYSRDGNFIITTSDDNTCKIWNSHNFELVRILQHPAPVQSASFNHKGNLIVTCAGDNLCRIWDSQIGILLFSFCSIGNEDYVFVLPAGEYMGTTNGVRKLSWRLNNKLYDFGQWDLQYNRPDKVLQQLGNTDNELIGLYKDAYLKRLKRAGFNESVFTDEWHAPETKIINQESLASITDSSQIKLQIYGTDSKYKIDRFFINLNDVPIFGSKGISVRNEISDSVAKAFTLLLSSGDNMINVSCLNEKGVESLKEPVSIIYNPKNPIPQNLYLIPVCVSKYLDSRYDLQYPVKDGKDIVRLFSSVPAGNRTFKKIVVDTLFNKNATRNNFLNIKNKLFLSSVEDEVVVFISGHGLLDKNLDFYYAAYNTDFSNPEKAGISFTQLEDLLDSIPARKKLLLVDACHSGEVDKEEIGQRFALNTKISPDITFRGEVKEFTFAKNSSASNQSSITLNNSFELMQELFSNLDRGTGTTVISAASGKGYALESPQWKNGVFTYSIINGLKNKAADKNGDGITTVSELKDYSLKQVPLLTGGNQRPTVRKESVNYDWKIW